jgi:hypothetical protein
MTIGLQKGKGVRNEKGGDSFLFARTGARFEVLASSFVSGV